MIRKIDICRSWRDVATEEKKVDNQNETLLCLLNILVNSFSLPSISMCRSSYEADFKVSVVSLISSFFFRVDV